MDPTSNNLSVTQLCRAMLLFFGAFMFAFIVNSYIIHEAGHALVQHFLPRCNTVRKVTIMPRGMALGVTWSMPDEDLFNMSASKLSDDIAGMLGGRVAEEIVFDEITTGASNDLDRVTRLARSMVTSLPSSSISPER